MKDNANTELVRQFYRNGLYHALAAEGNSPDKSAALCDEFDKLTDAKMSGEGAAGIIYAAYGSQNPRTACQTIKQYVQDQLAGFNGIHPGVDTNGRTRFLATIRTLNENVSKCSVLLDGVEMDREEIDREAKFKVPSCFKSPVAYEAKASNLGLIVNQKL